MRIDRTRASDNHGPRLDTSRPDALVLHYTGMRDGPSAIDWLCNPASQVSCHYVVTETGRILQLVDEDRRAWHAGRSFWRGETDLNSASIGVEIVNGGHDFGLPAFPPQQIAAVIALCRDIIGRHDIPPTRVLAHSDIAPSRKRDPGERFPWDELAEAGVGLWPCVQNVRIGDSPMPVAAIQTHLAEIGYGIAKTGSFDVETETVLCAFQRRYRPTGIDGRADSETCSLVAAVRAMHAAFN